MIGEFLASNLGLYKIRLHVMTCVLACIPSTKRWQVVGMAPIRSQNGGDRWNWSGKTLSPRALLAVLYFSLFHIYPSPPLSAAGSPRMGGGAFANFALELTDALPTTCNPCHP